MIMAKVFITKYALTEGIKEIESDILRDDFTGSEYTFFKYSCFYIGKANNVHVNMKCDGKCPRMRNYDKRNGILIDKEITD